MNDLSEIIRCEIAGEGSISFARFMELALYCPGCGYYERESVPVGRKGDFYTSVSVGSLFGELLAFQFAEWLEHLEFQPLGHRDDEDAAASHPRGSRREMAHLSLPQPSRSILASGPVEGPDDSINQSAFASSSNIALHRFQLVEAGAHDGRLALDILDWFHRCRPDLFETLDYWIVEPSPRRREWQENTLGEFAGRVRWHDSWDSLSPLAVRGVIFANELLDAFPVHRIGWNAAEKYWFEWGVAWKCDRFEWVKKTSAPIGCSTPSQVLDWPHLPPELLAVLPEGFTTELSPGAGAWWNQAARSLTQGKLVTLDYGLTGEGFFSPERAGGTLRAYRQHRVSSNLLDHVGEQDLTGQVNFTALQLNGEQAGLRTEALISQAAFLTRTAEKTWHPSSRFGEWSAAQKRQFQTLVHPEHLGRAFRVLIQSR